MHHFYLNDQELKNGESLIIKNKETVHQMHRVLRFKPGERFFIIDGVGKKYECRLKQINKNYIFAQIIDQIACLPLKRKIIIASALLAKKDKMELIFQKCSELGANGFEILITDKASVKHKLNFQRLEKIVTEAVEQSQRCFLPFINKTLIALGELNEKYPGFAKILLEPNQASVENLRDLLNKLREKSLVICVGPELGWSDFEIDFAKNSNWHLVSINGGVLKSETAAIAAAALFYRS